MPGEVLMALAQWAGQTVAAAAVTDVWEAARHMRPDQAEEFGKRNGVPGELIVRLRPTKVLAGFTLTG